jgi:hypothetical protein
MRKLLIGIIICFMLMIPSVVSVSINNTAQNKNFVSGISLITLKINGEKGLNDWYVQDVGVNITNESDDIAAIYYEIDGVPRKYTKPFFITEEDDGEDILFEWRAINYDGNYSDWDGPFIFNMDQTEPDIDLTYEWSGHGPPWEFTFIANATDATSGMERVEFWHNEELMKTVYGPGPYYTFTLLWEPPPYSIWKAIAYDMAGNSAYDSVRGPSNLKNSKLSMLYTGFNKKNSVISFSDDISSSEIVEKENNKATEMSPSDYSRSGVFDPGYIIVVFNRKMGNNGWIVSNVTIPIFYEFDRIDNVYYQLNFGSWNLYNDSLVISEDGIYVFSWYVVDSEGYTSTPETISLKIDRTPPEINLIRKRLEIDKVKIIADVYDEMSNIDRVEFNIDSPYYVEFTDYDFPYEWICSGIFNEKVTVSVYDKGGNRNTSSIDTWKCNSYFSTNSLVLHFFNGFHC